MYLNQLTPKNDYLEYIPEILIDGELGKESIQVAALYLKDSMRMEDCMGFIDSLNNIHLITRGEHPDYAGGQGTRATWFSTNRVVDVRLFFREFSHSGREGVMGSKMRPYSVGREEGGQESIQSIDSGFITYNSYPTAEHKFQSALSRTMFYNSLYAIGGRANVRKINEVNKNRDSNSPSAPREYKWLSALNPLPTDGIDWRDYSHILHPAAMEAGIENPQEYFDGFGGDGDRILDGIFDGLINAKSIQDLGDRLHNVPHLGLTRGDIADIIDASNCNEANLSGSKDFSDGKAVGVNVVSMMGVISDIFD